MFDQENTPRALSGFWTLILKKLVSSFSPLAVHIFVLQSIRAQGVLTMLLETASSFFGTGHDSPFSLFESRLMG